MNGRCSCGAYTESSSGLCGACIQRGVTLYSSSATTERGDEAHIVAPLQPLNDQSRQENNVSPLPSLSTEERADWTHVERLRAGYCEHSEAPDPYSGPNLCGDCTEAAADALEQFQAERDTLKAERDRLREEISAMHVEFAEISFQLHGDLDVAKSQLATLQGALKDASRTLKGCMSACAEKRAIGVQSQPCLVCRIETALLLHEQRAPGTKT